MTQCLHVIFDANGNQVKNEKLDANTIAMVLGAYLKHDKFFANVKYMDQNAKTIAQQAGIWSSGEDCYVEQNHNPLV
jgi:hypothetical protein